MMESGKGRFKYDFYEDPGHGWLKVDTRELERLGIADKISSCSYLNKGYAFLEEDDDLSVFFEAKKRIDGIDITMRSHHTDNRSKIRGYERYTPEGVAQ